MRIVWKSLAVLGLVLVVLIASIAIWAAWTVRRSYPQTTGTISLSGLGAPVDVLRDERGVPHIYADSVSDLFFANGYVHAQDRFWQMDFFRHAASGRLSELFGKSQVETDTFLRTLNWRGVAEQEVELLSPRSRQVLDSYARGVNAYLADHSGATLSLEYVVLGLNNPDYAVAPWTPADSVVWLKFLAWELHSNEDDEAARALTSAVVGVDRTEQLYPPYPYDRHQPIVTEGAVVDGAFDPVASPGGGSAGASARIPAAAIPALKATEIALHSLDGTLGPLGDGIGSNSWVVGSSLTDTGKPLLANDPHLGPMMPSIWYQAGLHCRTLSPACDYDVSGWTMAGLPGVFIGHNQRIAWGFTNLGPDTSDLVLEKVEGGSYLLDGQRKPLTLRQEVIEVAGSDPVTITVRGTEHGPIVSDVGGSVGEDATRVGQDAPVPAPGQDAGGSVAPRGDGYAVALRWTSLTPRNTFDALDAINTATDWEEFRAGAALLQEASQNLIYADVDGNIGYQAPGYIPIRRGYDGKWPVPGWTSDYGWDGAIPVEALPWAYNPPADWIATANQAVIGPDYAYFLTDDWAYGSRSQRIIDLIEQQTADGGRMTTPAMQDIQFDAWNELAAFLVPRMADLPLTGSAASARALFDGWDFQQQADSAPGAYYNAFFRQLMDRMFDSKLSAAGVMSNRSDRYWEVIETLWPTPDDAWWDDGTTPDQVETRDQTVTASLQAAADELTAAQGGDPAAWRWGMMHTLEIENLSLGRSGIAPVEWLFNRGPYELGGGGSIVQATGWTPSKGYTVNWIPSMRQVISLAEFDASTWVNLAGASGHAFNPHYNDQTAAWQVGDQYPWPSSPQAVDAAAVDRLTLQPAS